jgi:hypothetical protein
LFLAPDRKCFKHEFALFLFAGGWAFPFPIPKNQRIEGDADLFLRDTAMTLSVHEADDEQILGFPAVTLEAHIPLRK